VSLVLLLVQISVPLADVISAKKDGRKRVIVKTNKNSYIFGPFPADIKRSHVLQAFESRASNPQGEENVVCRT
jgi:hypothetical protein